MDRGRDAPDRLRGLPLNPFQHPHANREAQLSDRRVAYEFKRSRRRSIGFLISPSGLEVRAPTWVPLHQVDAASQEKSAWIIKKLAESCERQERIEEQRMEWRDGSLISFQGRALQLVLGCDEALIGAETLAEGAAAPSSLPLTLLRDASPELIRGAVEVWLRRQARALFIERLDHFAPQLQVHWRKLSLSNAATRWGSAGVNGTIRLNWRLIHFALPLIDYVVVHELSHLRVMNHSPRFWETVASVLPDYATLRRQLRGQTLPRWQ